MYLNVNKRNKFCRASLDDNLPVGKYIIYYHKGDNLKQT